MPTQSIDWEPLDLEDLADRLEQLDIEADFTVKWIVASCVSSSR